MTGNSSASFWTLSTVCWTALPTVFRVDRHLFKNCWHPSSRLRPRCRSRLFTSGQNRRSLPEPFGVVDFTRGGAGIGGVGDRLGAVSVVEPVSQGVGAVSVLDEYLVLGMVPEVEGLGEDGVVLGLDEVFDEVVDEGSLAQAEVLDLGGLTGGAGGCIGSGAGGQVMALVSTLGA
jgi:hypothetical protein